MDQKNMIENLKELSSEPWEQAAESDNITHWAYLPEPPEEEDNG